MSEESATREPITKIGIGASAGGLGALRALLARIAPSRTSEDRIERAATTSIDITHRSEAESPLHSSEHGLRQSLDAAATGTWWWDDETGDSGGDDRAWQIIRESIRTGRFVEAVADRLADGEIDRWWHFVRSGTEPDVEFVLVDTTDDTIHVQVNVRDPVAGETDERTAQRRGTIRDVTVDVAEIVSPDERSRRLTLLADAAANLLRGSDPDTLLPTLIDQISQAVGFEIYERYVRDDGGDFLLVSGNAPWSVGAAIAHGSGTEERRLGTSHLGFRICGEAARRLEPVLVNDLAMQPAGVGDGGSTVTAYGCFPLLAAGDVFGALSFATTGHARFDHDSIELMQTIVDDIAIALQRLRAEKELKELNQSLESRVRAATAELRDSESQLRQLASDLVRAEQSERQRIAQMLHDDVQQLLFGAQMRLGLLREDIADGRAGDVMDHLDETDRYVADTIRRTRHLSAELAPTSLDDDDLTESIGALVAQMSEMHGLDVVVETGSPLVIADRAIRLVVHQTVRELFFNVVKHAGVAQVKLAIRHHREEISIEVSDDGRGFDPDEVFNDPARNRRGLATLRQRLRLVGGSLDLESIPGDGTRALVRLPAGSSSSM